MYFKFPNSKQQERCVTGSEENKKKIKQFVYLITNNSFYLDKQTVTYCILTIFLALMRDSSCCVQTSEM